MSVLKENSNSLDAESTLENKKPIALCSKTYVALPKVPYYKELLSDIKACSTPRIPYISRYFIKVAARKPDRLVLQDECGSNHFTL